MQVACRKAASSTQKFAAREQVMEECLSNSTAEVAPKGQHPKGGGLTLRGISDPHHLAEQRDGTTEQLVRILGTLLPAQSGHEMHSIERLCTTLIKFSAEAPEASMQEHGLTRQQSVFIFCW